VENEESRPELVVIGASAGGIEALSSLVATLPTDFPAPIVVAQHLPPKRVSRLEDLLSRRSTLPVRTLADREPLQPGVIFVVPANRHVEITDHEVALRSDDTAGPRPSIDLLFSTAAHAFGERLVAVILTGTGSDGAAGARQVKAAGGTVVVQNPETASFPSMPLSLAPTTVDITANLEAIGPLLHDLLTGAYMGPRPDEDRSLQSFLEHVRDRSGVDFSGYKRPTIVRRLQRRMAATGTNYLRDYIRYTQRHPDEYQRLVSSFLIKVTEFFRDAELFRHLKEHLLPELIQAARTSANELRLWSAGCATGEEAYSLAILVSEALGDELERVHVRVFATDLDADAVAFARRGVYPASALTNLSPDVVARYFSEFEGDYEVKKSVRALTVFGQHDLGQRAPFPRIDLALCRNVLIYFTTELQKRALQLFAFSLREAGYLVLGKAETTTPFPEHFVLEHPRLKIFRRHGERVLIPPARIKQTTPLALMPVKSGGHAGTGLDLALTRVQREVQRRRTTGEKAEHLLLTLPIGTVIVDRHYDIQFINGAARRLMGIHDPAIGEDFIHLAQGLPSTPLRAAIDAALRGNPSANVYEVMSVDAVRHLEISCSPHKFTAEAETPEDAGNSETVVIVIADVTAMVEQRRELKQAYARQREETEHLTAQVQRANEMNRQLVNANQELANANAELRSANEELLVGNEEVQAATEEVETLNEELQASNEELETLNEELQASVEELNTTNDDLEARSLELQNLATSLEEQRRASDEQRIRVETILATMGDAVLVVDREGQPALTNVAFREMFGSADFVPLDEQGQPLSADVGPQRRAARGESFSMQFTMTSADGSRRWFEASGQPIGRDSADLSGVVVIRDITDRSLRHLLEEFMALASHELRTPLTSLSVLSQVAERHAQRRLQQGQPGGVEWEEEQRENLERLKGLRAQSAKLARLVDDLLDVSRLQHGKLALKLEPLDLVPVVTQAVEVAQGLAQGQAIHFDAPKEALRVNGDPQRLEQVLLNLLTNAIKYAPNTERIDVRLRRTNGEAEIEVRDYGPGIPAADLEGIFSRFRQSARTELSSEGGLGLGLFITRELVSEHGGSVHANSREGEGTAFTVRLPLLEEGARKPLQAAPRQ
jgi:two-component system CheB/CheR fusion protein